MPPNPPPKKKPTRKPAAKKSYGTYKGNPAYRGKGRKRFNFSFERFKPTKRALVILVLRLVMAGVIVVGVCMIFLLGNIPDVKAIDTIHKQQGITIEAADGHTVANYGDVYGEYIPYDQFPKQLIQAVVATEDRRFFEHHGVDIFGIFRAVFANLTHGHLVQGGSTITQQVAKNVFLTPKRSLVRKVQEVMLAFWLEGRFTKKEILAIYLNRVYLGSGTYGVDAAAHRYFNKSARDMNLEECALLAGLLKAPSRYSPASNSTRSRERMHQVLLNMEDAGYIKQPQVDQAMDHYIHSPTRQVEGGDVRYYTDWVLDDIPNLIGQVEDDLIVTTTMDAKLQSAAQDALQNIISTQGPAKNVSQGAVVSMAPDGAVKAIIGGMSYADSQYNRATQAKRQPGSSFKLFVYLTALEAGYTPQSIVTDAPISLTVGNKTWSPDNDDRNQYRGDIMLTEALRHSINTVSVRLITTLGPQRVASMAERLGVPNVPAYPSIALGAVEATLMEMTGAYAHMPNHGVHVEPYAITSIRTRAGAELYRRDASQQPQVLAKGTVEMMNYMLIDVVRHGTGIKANLGGREAGGKTGTSQDHKDAWFIGFTPQLVTGVWVGNDDNQPMKKVFGGDFPAQIWHDYMTKALEGQPAQSIPNSASNSDGILPWLFGGQNDDQGEHATPSPVAAPTTSPADSPFGAPSAPLENTPALAEPAKHDPDVLTPQFWNKLMDKAVPPNQRKVEYNYPGDQNARHRGN